jgi:hypothetical protein
MCAEAIPLPGAAGPAIDEGSTADVGDGTIAATAVNARGGSHEPYHAGTHDFQVGSIWVSSCGTLR